ncbi:hypothetical protein EDD22DRAFT_846824 [Suillus occidentalis]|nr:hypothetical protein EDD22DRAFT_846824 [Suillus occidentalis]
MSQLQIPARNSFKDVHSALINLFNHLRSSLLENCSATSASAYCVPRGFFNDSHYNIPELQPRPRWTIFSRGPPIIEVPAIRGQRKQYLLLRRQHNKYNSNSNRTGHESSTLPPVSDTQTTTKPFRALSLCPQHTDDDAPPTQQQEGGSQVQPQTRATSQQRHGQSQGQVQPKTQASSSQTRPAAPLTSATPTSSSHPNTLASRLFSLFRSKAHTNEDIHHVVEVAAMDDKGALFVAGQPQPDLSHPQSANTAQPGSRPAHSLFIRFLAHLALFLCCKCNHQRADSNPQPTQQPEGQSQDPVQTHATSLQTQQQAQSQGQDQAHASSSQTQPAPSTSTTPTSRSHPDPLISCMSSLFCSQTHTHEEIELSEFPSRPHVVEVALVQDRETSLALAGQFMQTQDTSDTKGMDEEIKILYHWHSLSGLFCENSISWKDIGTS